LAVRIKICGITRQQDAHAAVAAGAHGLGFVFHTASARYIEPEQAFAIARSLPPFVTLVGVFVDAEPGLVAETVRRVPLDLVQLHGDESPEYARQLSLPYIRAIRMQADIDLAREAGRYPEARAILVDSYVAGKPGGTGRTFAWDRIPASLDRPLILAGGLTADNVAGAIQRVRPYAVDVSGGVENAPGVKDPDKIKRFVTAVNNAA